MCSCDVSTKLKNLKATQKVVSISAKVFIINGKKLLLKAVFLIPLFQVQHNGWFFKTYPLYCKNNTKKKLFETKKVNSTMNKKRPDEIFIRAFPLKLNIIMKRFISLYF